MVTNNNKLLAWREALEYLLDNPPVDCDSIYIDSYNERIILYNEDDLDFDNLDHPIRGKDGIVEIASFATVRKINCK